MFANATVNMAGGDPLITNGGPALSYQTATYVSIADKAVFPLYASKAFSLGADATKAVSANFVAAAAKGAVKPTGAPPAAPADAKAKAKRHSCGQGAMHLVIGASTVAAASMLLY